MLVFFVLLVWSVTYRDEYTEDEIFIRTESGLTEVPTDIPSGAKTGHSRGQQNYDYCIHKKRLQ